jgi:hypothetical protein
MTFWIRFMKTPVGQKNIEHVSFTSDFTTQVLVEIKRKNILSLNLTVYSLDHVKAVSKGSKLDGIVHLTQCMLSCLHQRDILQTLFQKYATKYCYSSILGNIIMTPNLLTCLFSDILTTLWIYYLPLGLSIHCSVLWDTYHLALWNVKSPWWWLVLSGHLQLSICIF